MYRLPTLFKTVQDKSIADKDHEKFPLILTSGRLVEYEGGGEETRSNPWLAELQQDNFVEINPTAAADRGIRDGEYVWVHDAHGGQDQGQGAGDRAGGGEHGVRAVPLLRLVGRQGHAALLSRRARTRSCAARR